MNEYEIWKTSFSTTEGAYTCLFYFGLVAYPLFTTLVSLFRGNRIIVLFYNYKIEKNLEIFFCPVLSLD